MYTPNNSPDVLEGDAERLISDLNRLIVAGVEEDRGEESARESSAPKILLVDDCADYRDVVRGLLENNGCQVVVAANGAEGLRQAIVERPDLVLVDFDMPQMNGYELVQELRIDFDLRRVPIIMCTGKANRSYLRGAPMHISDYLEKPISGYRLLESVNGALGRKLPPAPAHQIVMDPRPGTAPPRREKEKGEAEEEEAGLEALAQESTLVDCVNRILRDAVRLGASDIHIEPQESAISVRVRLNGSLNPLCTLPATLAARLSARIKILSCLVITERRRPQDGQFRFEADGKKVEFRVSVLPGVNGEKIVLRVLGAAKIKTASSEIGFNPRDLECFEKAVRSPNGLILVTGPTGSGKTTTLYTVLGMLNNPDVNIMTVEDPVECRLPGITQVQIKPGIGLTFDAVLRSLLRQDPDIMLIGEIRDSETAEIAVRASITGHLVFSTLHTNSAPASIARLTQMGIKPFLAAASLKMVVAQRLVKRLCPECKMRDSLGEGAKSLLTDEELSTLKDCYRGVGCCACGQTGYVGRRSIFEVMPIRTAAMRQLILSSNDIDLMTELAVNEGMTSLRRSALALAASGETSMNEALKIILSE